MKKRRLDLTAEAFDALHIGSLAFGGIGRKTMWAYEILKERDETGKRLTRVPVCAVGILECAGMEDALSRFSDTGRLVGDENDRAVALINRRRGKPIGARVPFVDWALEMNVHIVPEAITDAE